jgi:hypothetical protein
MTNEIEDDSPVLTIVGGQPARRTGRDGEVRVPVGLEKLLFLAAEDEGFRERLLHDWRNAAAAADIDLRPSEIATLEAANRELLARMIDGIVPSNPRRRRFMGLVAAVATSLAAGTVLIDAGCGEVVSKGCDPGTDADGDADGDTDDDAGPDAGDTDSD